MLACAEMPEINVDDENAANVDDLTSFFDREKKIPKTTEFTAKVHEHFICEHVFIKRYHFSKQQFEDWVADC